MKLVEPPRHTSFYETFSDLIFGTLCIFMVIVLALTLKLDVEVDRVVSPSRFQGGADYTSMYSIIVKIKDRWHVMWIPLEHHENRGIQNPDVEVTNQMFREIANEEYLLIGVDELDSILPGVQGEFKHFFHMGIWNSVQTFHDEQRLQPAALRRAIRAGELQAFLLQSNSFRQDPELSELAADFDSFRSAFARQIAPIATKGEQTSNLAPSIRFSTQEVDGKRTVRVGRRWMTVSKFLYFLRSIKPGKGFFIEYVDAEDQPATPPDWVHEQILARSGYNGRVVSEFAQTRS